MEINTTKVTLFVKYALHNSVRPSTAADLGLESVECVLNILHL